MGNKELHGTIYFFTLKTSTTFFARIYMIKGYFSKISLDMIIIYAIFNVSIAIYTISHNQLHKLISRTNTTQLHFNT